MSGEGTLLPCPMCGGEGNLIPEWDIVYVACGKCFTRSGYAGTSKAAIDVWNRRTLDHVPDVTKMVAPMTSVVTWVAWERGDYDADTLPDSGQLVVVRLVGRDIFGPATLEYDGTDKSFYWAFKEKYGDRVATAGDIWAYLPVPPEGDA